MKRNRLLCAVLLCAAAVLTACASSSRGDSSAEPPGAPVDAPAAAAPDRAARMREYGRLERLRMDIPADAPAAVRAEHFTISVQEVDALTAEYVAFNGYDEDTAREKALGLLIEEYTVRAWAAEEGIAADEASVQAIIADEQDSDADDPAGMRRFLQGFDGDEALYRSFQKEDLRGTQTAEAFRDWYREKYEAAGGTDFTTDYRAAVEERIAGEHVELIAPEYEKEDAPDGAE